MSDPQRALLDRMPQPAWTAADGGSWTWASARWRAYTGMSDAESRGEGWLAAVHPKDRALTRQVWAAAAEEVLVEHRLRRADGRYRWFQSRAAGRPAGGSSTTEWLGISVDIHALRSRHDQQQGLVRELHHRTRNLMAIIRAVASASGEASDSVEAFQARFFPRLDALARVQGLLADKGDADHATIDRLLRAEFRSLGVEIGGREGRVALAGPADVALGRGQAQMFALALHELAANALRYGALSRAGGTLAVNWRLERSGAGPALLRFEWRERGGDGGGAPPGERRKGFGRELIEDGLPFQINAKVRYEVDADGASCVISAPIADDEDRAADDD